MKQLYCLFILFLSLSAQAQIDTTSLSAGKNLSAGKKLYIDSEILNEKVEVWLRLPSEYGSPKDSTALLILLDGDEYFKAASDIAELYEFAKVMPRTLIVGLPSTVKSRWAHYTPSNVKYTEKSNPKVSLLWSSTGQFSLYADFMQKELLPMLRKLVNTEFSSKTIFGHSNGGLAVLSFYTLAPSVFDKYIAASPAILWGDYFIQKNINSGPRKEALYMTLGTGGWDYKLESYKPLREKLRQTNSQYKFVVYDQDAHSTTGLRTLLDGLRYVHQQKK
jgi:predicted alpha/beta superfamily hydrolase